MLYHKHVDGIKSQKSGTPLFHSHGTTLTHHNGVTRTDGFRVIGAIGRPPVYNGTQIAVFADALKRYGLSGARKHLAARGVNVSLTALGAIAKGCGVEFKRGRRVAA